jgi:hypothetical protein
MFGQDARKSYNYLFVFILAFTFHERAKSRAHIHTNSHGFFVIVLQEHKSTSHFRFAHAIAMHGLKEMQLICYRKTFHCYFLCECHLDFT